jgi:hypothetical protein
MHPGPPPTNERRRPRAAVGTNADPVIASEVISGHCASVGVTEIEEKFAENARKYAYYEALLAAENTHLHDEPIDVKEAQGEA